MALSLNRKRALDHVVGRPALKTLNLMTRALGWLMKRNHGVDPVKTILIMKFQGMGSLALAYPAIAALRKEYPAARVVFWGTPATNALATLLPEFDECLVLDDRSALTATLSLLRTLPRLWALKIDWGFDFEVYSKLSAILLTLTCARNRAGFAVDTITSRKDCHTHLVMFNRYQYLGRAYARLVGLILRKSKSVDLLVAPPWKVAPQLPSALQNINYVVFNPNVGDLSLERAWPIESFDEAIAGFITLHPHLYVVLTGKGAAEVARSARIARHSRLIDLTDKLTLPELIGTLTNARGVVTADTSALHLALLTSAPVVALFGPTLPATYFPFERTRTKLMFQGMYCSPCVHHWHYPPCRGNNQCMKSIRVAEVTEALAQVMGTEQTQTPSSTYSIEFEGYYPGLIYDKDLKEV
jgi:ADP-heptose:LPS heptosyltransferase